MIKKSICVFGGSSVQCRCHGDPQGSVSKLGIFLVNHVKRSVLTPACVTVFSLTA